MEEDPASSSIEAAMEEDPITASLGPMDRLLRRLSTGSRLPKGINKGEIQRLKEVLEGLSIELTNVSEAEDHSFTAKCWMKEVRELCYDTEDYFDEAVRSAAGVGKRLLMHKKLKWAPFPKREKLNKRLPQIANGFSELMARLNAASKRRKSFQIGPKAIKPEFGQAVVKMPQLSLELLEGLTNKLVKMLAALQDNREIQLKVVPIFGFAGVGKTTLARTLYHKLRGEFQCRAFIRVSRDPDMRRLLTSMLSQIKAPRGDHGYSDAQDLVYSIREHLQGKRYLIIIDDLWSTSVWDVISRAFPDGDCRSRIITTTEIEDVALACSSYHLKYIFEMRHLNDDQSGKVEGGCTYPTSEGMEEAVNLIYNDLPPHLKTCLLYVSMYPEGHTIRKDELVKQWVAEGFLRDIKGQDTEEIAGSYFNELVSNGMIQPVETSINGEVLSCTVHHTILDLIRYKSMEENFITIVDYFQTTLGFADKVRRLSVQFGGAKCANVPETIRMSQVRSLLFHGFTKSVPSIVDYGLLRILILHIWADQDNTSFDLTRIYELVRLRYLKIECNITVNLPDKIRGLQYLGTLEVDARLSAVPADIVHLQSLLHLRVPSQANLPRDIGHMTSLRTLGYFDLSSNSTENVMNLGELTNLQDLQLTCCIVQPPADNQEDKMKCLGSILEKLRKLKSVTLVPTGSSHENALGASSTTISCDGLGNLSSPPALLQRFELSPRICIFSSLPKWIGELSNLCILKIAVRELSNEDIDILKVVPALTALSLYVWTTPVKWIIFDKNGFPVLRYFKFTCTAPYLTFVEGAMPNVRRLKLRFNANTLQDNYLSQARFARLSGLEEISAKIWGIGADESDRENAERALNAAFKNRPRSPIINVQSMLPSKKGSVEQYGDTSRTLIPLESTSRLQNPDNMPSGSSVSGPGMPLPSNISTKKQTVPSLQSTSSKSLRAVKKLQLLMEDPATISATVGLWGMKAAGWVASSIISEIFKKGYDYLGFDVKRLNELEPKVLLLERVMEVVEKSPDRPRLEQLFEELKSAFYEAEDILDDIEYHRLEKQIQDGNRESFVPKSSPLKNKLKESLDKIETVINDAYKILEGLNLPSLSIDNRSQAVAANSRGSVTTAAPPPVVIGRDEECEKIIAMLHDKEGDGQSLCYSVLGIYGIGGSGKSTLAQLVCAREKKDSHFDLVMWVYVSQDFSLPNIFSQMIEEATGEPSSEFGSPYTLEWNGATGKLGTEFGTESPYLGTLEWNGATGKLGTEFGTESPYLGTLERNLEATGEPSSGFESLYTLAWNLRRNLYGKRFLLVLDDVWNNIMDWRQELLYPLRVGEAGSKILVTSRTQEGLLYVGAPKQRCIPISELDEDVFLKLFRHYVGAMSDDRIQKLFESVGAKIAKMLRKSPLAASTVGPLLGANPRLDFWKTTQNWAPLNEMMGALWWSYQHLDEHVRRCFAFCSIFPRRHGLKRDELVHLWVAEGFIKNSTNAWEEMEDVGQGYFNELVSASFLKPGGWGKEYYVVHDLLHDLAEKVAGSDCFRIEHGWTGEVPPDVRHLYIGCDKFLQKFLDMLAEKDLGGGNVRTLIINIERARNITYEVEKSFEGMLKRLPKLRVLTVRTVLGAHMFPLPASIGQLKHLRYLAFPMDPSRKPILPGTFAKLYHIQVLDFGYFKDWRFSSSEDAINLGNLRYIVSLKIGCMAFPNIGRLTSLQTLPRFQVIKERGYELKQLRDLNKLRGTLHLCGLGNVESKEEALEANLAAKEGLTELVLTWDTEEYSYFRYLQRLRQGRAHGVKAEVLEGLCPPMGLQRLEIRHYSGSRYPNWMVDKQNGGPENLQELVLFYCIQLEAAPALFQVFTGLRSLSLSFCWNALPDNIRDLTKLEKLKIYRCWEMRSLPDLPLSLKYFELEFCNREFMESCVTTGDPNWEKIQHIPNKRIDQSNIVRRLRKLGKDSAHS